MDIEHIVILVLVGYALGLTMALFSTTGKAQTQPQTIVVQQAPNDQDATGCGATLTFALIALILLIMIVNALS